MEEINIKDLFNFFISKIKIIGIIVGVFVILVVLYVKFLQVPMYHSATTLILVSDNNNNNSAAMQSDINLNKFQLLEIVSIIDEFSVKLQYNVNIKLWLDSLLIKLTEVKNEIFNY